MEHVIKRGNTVQLNWTLHSISGSEFSLSGYTARLYYRHGSGRALATGTTTANNVLTWTFQPDAQWKNGDYDIELEVYANGSKLITLQYPKAFTLYGDYTETSSQSSGVQTVDTTLNITSSCDFNKFSPVIPVVNTTSGKWEVNGVPCTDGNGNPIYAYPTIQILDDGTIWINRGRFNQQENDSLKNYLRNVVIYGVVSDDEFDPQEISRTDIVDTYLAGCTVIFHDVTTGDYETVIGYSTRDDEIYTKNWTMNTASDE